MYMNHPPAFLRSSRLLLLLTLLAVGSSFGREPTEWMTSYWYNASDNKLPRVLLIGDSICNGYQPFVRDELAGTAYVSFFATSKCATDPTYLKALAFMLDEYDYKVIHFNNGLHSLNTDRGAWTAGLSAALNLIREKGKGAKVIWATSTPLKDPALTDKAKELNLIADGVMKSNSIPVDDLFSLMNPLDRNAFWVDTYHCNEKGRKMEAKQVADSIRQALGAKQASAADAKASLAAAASETGPNGKISTASPAAAPLVNQSTLPKGAWKVWPQTSGAFELSPENPHSGTNAAKITVSAPHMQLYQSDLALEAGASYTLKYWARSASPLKMDAFIRNTRPPYTFLGKNTAEVDASWKVFSATFTAPTELAPDGYKLFFEFPAPGACWIDDVSLSKQ